MLYLAYSGVQAEVVGDERRESGGSQVEGLLKASTSSAQRLWLSAWNSALRACWKAEVAPSSGGFPDIFQEVMLLHGSLET